MIWAITSTLTAFPSLVGWLLFGVTGLVVVFLATFVLFELALLLFIRPSAKPVLDR